MKVTLITGASAGIGEAFARQLASERHNLLLVARSENKLSVLCDELMAEYNISAQYIAVDLVKPNAHQVLFSETEKRGLQVEWLINNAGIGSGGDFLEHEIKSEIDMMHLNMDAAVALTHCFLPQMRARRSGKIINVASLAAFAPIPYMAVYGASKVFIRSFTEAIAEENRPFNIQVMLLCPGATETNFFEAAQIGPDRKSSFSSKKLETPEQVVDAAMKGLRKNKRITVSGFKNRIIARLTHLIPNALGLPLFAKQKRAELNLKNS
jgi:short-subunit dehydrogenase